MKLRRIAQHLVSTRWRMRQRFDTQVCDLIASEIAAAELLHAGEICFAVEHALDAARLRAGVVPRVRALELFGSLGVWDTEHNNGVLIYVLLADRSVEFIADRGLNARIGEEEWAALCRAVETHFRAGQDAEGSVAAIRGVAELLQKHFPLAVGDRNELPNQPVLL